MGTCSSIGTNSATATATATAETALVPATKPPATPQDHIQQLKQKIKDNKKREAHFRHQIELLKASAMEKLNSGNKKGAVMDLKRSKTYEKQVDMILSVTGTLQTQVDNWESSITNAANFKAMALSTDAMKKSAVIVGQEQVDQMMDDTKDLNVAINETNLAFAQDIDVDVMDDDDLLAELHDMKPAKPAAPTLPAPTLPAVPNRPLPAWEEDFKKLEAELAA